MTNKAVTGRELFKEPRGEGRRRTVTFPTARCAVYYAWILDQSPGSVQTPRRSPHLPLARPCNDSHSTQLHILQLWGGERRTDLQGGHWEGVFREIRWGGGRDAPRESGSVVPFSIGMESQREGLSLLKFRNTCSITLQHLNKCGTSLVERERGRRRTQRQNRLPFGTGHLKFCRVKVNR